jgi:hypothetical protein
MDVAAQRYNAGTFELNGFGRLSDIEGDVECLRRAKGVNMMLDTIPIWKTHDASDGDNRHGRNEPTVFLHDFRLNGGQHFLLRAFGPDNRALDRSARLIFYQDLNVSADRADHKSAQKQEGEHTQRLALKLPEISDLRT